MEKPKTLIRIDTQYVSVRDNGDLVRYTGVGSFANTFFGYYRPQAGLLPPAVRWMSRDGRAFLCERPPFEANIYYTDSEKVDAELAYGEKSVFRIQIPWQVYLVQFADERLNGFKSLHLAARKTSIRSKDDELCNMPLPNMMDNLECCMGDQFFDQYVQWRQNQPHFTTGAALQFVLNSFWMLGFNTDAEIPENRVPLEVREHIEEDGYIPAKALLQYWEDRSLSDVLEWNYTSDFVTTVDEWMQQSETTNPSPSAKQLFLEYIESAIGYNQHG